MKIAILYDENRTLHSTNWSVSWMEFCEVNRLDYKIINPFINNIFKNLKDFDIVLWHFSHFNPTEMLMARDILYSLSSIGKLVFPNYNEVWHFDDKLAESYLLECVDAPIPSFYSYYKIECINKAIKNREFDFPIIAKLRRGSGSHNVKMIRDERQLLRYSKKMFTGGFEVAPSLFFKAKSNIKSAHSIQTFIERFKRIPEFLRIYSTAKKLDREKGYVYLQEMVENDGYDLKIVVVGDKLSYVGRPVRAGDFRASGGGSLFYDRKKIPENVLDSAFETSKKLGFQCMGYDYVIDKTTGEGKIVEISYGFSHKAILGAQGYYDRTKKWHDTPINVPKEILNNLIKEFQKNAIIPF